MAPVVASLFRKTQLSPAGIASIFFRPEYLFLSLAVVVGLSFLFLTPPFQVPDEGPHFYRAFQISEGGIIPKKEGDVTGDYLPTNFRVLSEAFRNLEMHPENKISAAAVLSALDVPFNLESREFTWFSNTGIHPPLIYFPQSLGILVARTFSHSVLVAYYAGRLANLFITAFLFALAIRLTPILKWCFFVLALTPMSLFLMSSLSSDAMTNALCFLLVAQVLRCAFGPEGRVGWSDACFLVIMGAAAGLTKQAYFPLILSYFLIPFDRFGSRVQYWALFGALCVAVLCAAGAWGLVVHDVYSPAVAGKVDPVAQWRYVLSHPGEFAVMLGRSFTADFANTVVQCVGTLGVLDVHLSHWLLGVELALFVLTLTLTNGPSPNPRQSLLAFAVVLLNVLFIYLVIHLTWDKVGPGRSIDVQGRYFIPLTPLAAVGCSGFVGRLQLLRGSARWLLPWLTVGAVSVLLVVSAHTLYGRYYVDQPAEAAARAFDEGQQLLKSGKVELAVNHFEKSLELNPSHALSHFNLGVIFARTQPREAVRHYRAALTIDPGYLEARINLANTLARQGDFSEAIEHYQAALKSAPGDPSLSQNLQHALAMQEKLHAAMERIGAVLPAWAQSLAERRYVGAEQEGAYLQAAFGEIRNSDGKTPFPSAKFYWRSAPPAGDPIQLFDRRGELLQTPRRPRFYACGADLIGGRRIFVFPPPLNAVLLVDEDVSWLFQLRMEELTGSERVQELAYRDQRKLQFPRDLRAESGANPK